MNPKTEPTRIGIIGAGWLGGTVGRLWVQAEHEVMFSSRHPDELRSVTGPLGSRALVGAPKEAAQFGPIVLIAIAYDALPATGREFGDMLNGKIVLDACNAGPGNHNDLTRETQANGVGPTSAKYLPGARLVRAFSAVDATSVEASCSGRGEKLGVPLASDDAEAMKAAVQLVIDAGCEPVVVGDLAAGRSFERGGPGFRANTSAANLRRRLGLAG